MNIKTKATGVDAALDTMSELRDRCDSDDKWTVEATADYAGYVERGTSRMPAQPFMAPAQQTVEANLMRYLARASNMDAALRDIAFAIEGEAKRNAPVRTGHLRSTIRARKR